jgi:hypothetical protein
MISGLIRFLLLVFVGYIIFSFVSFVIRAVTHFIAAQKKTEMERDRREERLRNRGSGEKGTVIELDRDQYKVE